MLHYPFHLAMALTLEGLRTWTIIANVQYNLKKIYGHVDRIIGASPDIFRLSELSPEMGSQIVRSLNETIDSLDFETLASWDSMQQVLLKMDLAWHDEGAVITAPIPGNNMPDKNSVLRYFYDEFASLVQNEQFVSNSLEVPAVQAKAANGSGAAQMDAYFAVFKMIFIYFFVCTALVMIILGAFRSMSLGAQDRLDRALVVVRLVAGFFLGMMALMALVDDRITSYIQSGVLLPTLLFVLIFVVGVEKISTIIAIKKAGSDFQKLDDDHGSESWTPMLDEKDVKVGSSPNQGDTDIKK